MKSEDIPAGTFKDCWHGEKMDLDLAVGAMFQQERRAGRSGWNVHRM